MATVNLTFNIYLPDADFVRQMQEAFPDGWVHAPGAASTELAAELGYAVPLLNSYFPQTSPSVQTPWIRAEAEADRKFPTDVAVFRIGSDGFWGGLFGSNTRYIWLGRFHYLPLAGEAGIPTEGAPEGYPVDYYPIPTRKWIDGMELRSVQLGQGEGNTGIGASTPEASRVLGGYGLATRANSFSSGHSETELGHAASSNDWQTYYCRLRRAPSTSVRIHQMTTVGGTGAAAWKAYVGLGGILAFYNVDSASTETLAFTVAAPLVVGEWTRIDVFTKLTMANPPPLFNTWQRYTSYKVWVNGVEVDGVTDFLHSNHFGAVVALTCGTSELGAAAGGGTLEMDFDDWRGAACPDRIFMTDTWSEDGPQGLGGDYAVGNETMHEGSDGVTRVYRASAISGASDPHEPGTEDGADFWTQMLGPFDLFIGFHLQSLECLEFSANHNAIAWPGNIRTLQRRHHGSVDSTELVSTTSGGILEVTMDATRPLQLGAGAVVVAVHGNGAAAANQLGAGIAGAAASSAVITQDGTMKWTPRLFNMNGTDTEPRVVHPLVVRLTKDASATQRDVSGIGAVVEYFGVFDACDQWAEPGVADPDPVPEVAEPAIKHNAPFPDSPWGITGTPRFGGVYVKTGTYVGNDTGQDLEWAHPPHWLIIRPVTSPAGGQKWWSTMFRGPHIAANGSMAPQSITVVKQDTTYESAGGETDPEEKYLIRINGNNSQCNANAVVYQYMMFSDPAARHLLCGAHHHGTNAVDASVANDLEVANFLPDWAWLWAEFHSSDDTGTTRSWIKTPANLTDTAVALDGSEAATRVEFTSAGVLTTKSGVHASGSKNLAILMARMTEPDEQSEGIPFQIRTYTGNGSSPREIPLLTPGLSGCRPLFAIVVPDNAAAWFRDCGHLTGMSSTLSAMGAPAANGITAGGVDSITVGSSLNSNGVDYGVLVIPGSPTAGTDGWSICGEFMLKEPAQAEPGPFTDDDEDPDDDGLEPPDDDGEDGDGDGPTLDTPGLDDDLDDAACVLPTHNVVNQALQRIGVNIPIADLGEELSAEAAAVRLAYDSTMREVLRRLPWPFATRYQTLVLLAGTSATAANPEWQYQYRLPDRCVFPRRLVASRGDAVDPTPPPFRETQGSIMTNQADARMEYTCRPDCPATNGDAMFLNAWTWRLAAELAPPLTRMSDRAVHCLEMYEHSIEVAKQVLRLGSPGLRPAVDAADPDALTLTEKLQTLNVALMRIGAKTIADLATEQSREAGAALLVYEDELRSTLRDNAWPFATRYETLVLVDGEEGDEATPDHVYSYRAPSNMLFARRIVKARTVGGGTRRFDPAPVTFMVGSDDIQGSDTGGLLILTDQEDAILEYTIRPSNIWNVADSQFKDAFCWRLAAALAPGLAVPDPQKEEQTGRAPKVEQKEPRPSESGKVQLERLRMERARWCYAMYERVLDIAKQSAGNEQQMEKDGDASWIRDRD